ncbi:MAG: CDP-alcohol phosphatidyltransferase family protein [Candidatus Zixiibacteriota bacterium]
MKHLPNLLSLSRIGLIPFIGYYLSRPGNEAVIICTFLLGVAALTDLLDGYLARRLHQITRLGIALDPIADKILAAALVVLLVFYRSFPLWLAAVIIGRDLLILLAGLILLRRQQLVVPSNLTGKYAFVSIAVLLFSYVIRFEFGIVMMTYLTLILVIASIVNYAVVFAQVRREGAPRPFADRALYKGARITATAILAGIYAFGFFVHAF